MKDTQNEFYSSISNYYHEIFPYNPAQLKFVETGCGSLSGKKILDIGCATGELAFELAKAGAEVTGIDLNEDLLRRAQAEKIHPRLTFQKGDMLNLEEAFQSEQFDAVLCFGNTLVHLSSENHIKKMLNGVGRILKPGSVLLLQILNYDYIVDEPVTDLPVIETGNIRFKRTYKIKSDSKLIIFSTELHLKNESKTIVNETPLYALRSDELVNLLNEAAFKDIKLYSSFKEDEFGGKHLPLVVKAYKSK